jgi:hypothetical protein
VRLHCFVTFVTLLTACCQAEGVGERNKDLLVGPTRCPGMLSPHAERPTGIGVQLTFCMHGIRFWCFRMIIRGDHPLITNPLPLLLIRAGRPKCKNNSLTLPGSWLCSPWGPCLWDSSTSRSLSSLAILWVNNWLQSHTRGQTLLHNPSPFSLNKWCCQKMTQIPTKQNPPYSWLFFSPRRGQLLTPFPPDKVTSKTKWI